VSGPGNAVFSPDNHQRNATVTVDQFGAYRFAWSVVNVTCSSSDVVDVVFRDLPSLNAGINSEVCKGGSIQLNATGTGSFAWTPAELLNNPSIKNPVATPLVSTTFKVVLTDQFGCKNSDDILIDVREKPVADAGADQLLEYVFETTMDAQPVNAWETGVWSVISGGGEFDDENSPKSAVTAVVGINQYAWTVSNKVCPVSSDTVTIEVKDFIVPTLITPNMDGINDYFVLRGLKTLGKTEITVFDRRGLQVYKNSDYDNSWNGVDYNDNPLTDDTYYYVLKAENGKSVSGYIVIRY
jgi:gliding motility-associated-like protein